MTKFVIIGLLLLFIYTGCEEIYDFPDAGQYKKIPVIEAVITNQAGHQKVRVSYTVLFNDSVSDVPVSDAKVEIVGIAGDTSGFRYTENGCYTSDSFVALPGIQYTLLVHLDTTIYRSASMMVPVHGLDSLSCSFNKKTTAGDSAYYLKLYAGPTDPDNQKYYQIQIYRNKKLFTTGNNFLLLSDLAASSLDGIEIEHGFSKNDTLDVELYSLTREMFYYYVYVFNYILYNGNIGLDFKTNPPIQFAPDALGYFQVSSLSRKSIIMR
jgi:hypothetical protein